MTKTLRWIPSNPLLRWMLYVCCAVVAAYLLLPVVVVIPLSFNAAPFFTFPLEGFSTRWYIAFFNSPEWQQALANSFIVGTTSTLLATGLGTMGALGLSELRSRARNAVLAVVLLPVVVPMIVTALGLYFFFAQLHLTATYTGLVLAHTFIGVPLVVLTVLGSMTRFDRGLPKAAQSLGASPLVAFMKVTLPVLAPGIVSGAVLSFATSFDEVIIVLFVAGPAQRTLPRQMWAGVNQELNPTIAAAATIMIVVSVVLMLILRFVQGRKSA